jgi:hypothetical protein
MKRWQLLTVIVGGLVLSGCSAESSAPTESPMAWRGGPAVQMKTAVAGKSAFDLGVDLAGGTDLTHEVATPQDQADVGKAPAKAMPTKIIRTGDVSLIVDNFDEAFARFKADVEAIKDAYIAKAEISGSTGSPRRGTWKVRIPTASFDKFMTQMAGLGVPDRNVIDSRDVTEEYYDVEARLRNKKAEEARLVKHLDTSTGKLEEILKVEHEISRVRGEIEQMEGRLRMIDNLSSLTTVSVTMQEIKNYVPAQAPTFSNRVARTFGNSTDALVNFGEGVVLFSVAVAPWLPLIAVAVLLLYIGGNVVSRRIASRSGVKATPTVTSVG